MRFIFELYDDKEYKFWHRHKVVVVVCSDIDRAGDHVRKLYPSPGWYIAQVSRAFEGTEIEQPVFDEINGFLFSQEAINKARSWDEAVYWEERHGTK